ncbi:MAG: ABC transporter substrate-binding protein [Gemmatimonadaceae bacterium]|nr:ABC transporter substrate-binding protein [Acetobacteraceae bacterium]
MRRRHLLAAPLILPFLPKPARAATELVVHYPMPAFFKDVMETVASEFTKANPDITIRFPAPSPNYEEGLQQVIRQSAAGGLPDVSFQGLNRLRFLAERNILVDLTPFVAKGDAAALGWTPGILRLAQVGGKQVGLTFSASNPICYYNANLVRAAGGDPENFPKDWDGVLALAAKIAALGDGVSSMHYRWAGDDWMFSALLYGNGGQMLSDDEKTVAFGQPGLAALKILDRMVKEGKMPPLTVEAALQAFYAGKLGIFMGTTAYIGSMTKSVGKDVDLRSTKMPFISAQGRLPTGGNAGVMLTRDAARQEAAWKFLGFAAGPVGQTIMVRGTGYVPSNTLTLNDDRYLGAFYRDSPLFRPAMEQIPIMQPWFAFPGSNGVRITQTIVDNLARIVEQRATPEQVLADVTAEVQRLLPRA